MDGFFKKCNKGFTLTEVLLAVLIIGIVAALVLPVVVSKSQERVFDLKYNREIQIIKASLDSLAVSENKSDFFSTMMYRDTDTDTYSDSVEKYMKKYLRLSKYCGDNDGGDCFAKEYYEYSNNDKIIYKPAYKGGCAILKNGSSLCITPQIGAANIKGIIDLNGLKGPNIKGRDLREFIIEAKTRQGRSTETSEIIALDEDPIRPDEPVVEVDPPEEPVVEDPCKIDRNSLDCCKKRSITSASDVCCTYSDIKDSVTACNNLITYEYALDCTTSDNSSNKYLNSGICRFKVTPMSPDFEADVDFDCTTWDYIACQENWTTTGDVSSDYQKICSWSPYGESPLCHFYDAIIRYNGKIINSLSKYNKGTHTINVEGTYKAPRPD